MQFSFTAFSVFLFLKVSAFSLGVTFLIAYLFHRIVFYLQTWRLNSLFPEAFNDCFKIVLDFFDIVNQSKDFEVNKFLSQIASRRKAAIPKQFNDLPINLVKSAYQKLRRLESEFKLNPDKVKTKIREETYQEYFQRYRYAVLNESFNWLLFFIPIAFLSGLLLPLIIYFYMTEFLNNWPLLWTVAGILLGLLTLMLTLRDYYFKR